MRGSVQRKPEAINGLQTKVDAGGFVLGDGDIEEGSVAETHKVTVIITLDSSRQDRQENNIHA